MRRYAHVRLPIQRNSGQSVARVRLLYTSVAASVCGFPTRQMFTWVPLSPPKSGRSSTPIFVSVSAATTLPLLVASMKAIAAPPIRLTCPEDQGHLVVLVTASPPLESTSSQRRWVTPKACNFSRTTARPRFDAGCPSSAAVIAVQKSLKAARSVSALVAAAVISSKLLCAALILPSNFSLSSALFPSPSIL